MTARPEVLRGAAQMVRTGGLTKGMYQQGQAHCTIGALAAAAGRLTVAPELRLLTELLGGPGGVGVIAWNDDPDRTASDVIELLELAAEKAEADR